MNEILLDDETIQKALEILGLADDDTDNDILKAAPKAQMPDMDADEDEEGQEPTEEDDEAELEKACEMKKAELEEMNAKLAKIKKGKKPALKAQPDDEEGDETPAPTKGKGKPEMKGKKELPGLFGTKPEPEPIKKAIDADMIKGVLNEFQYAINDKNEALLERLNVIEKSYQNLLDVVERLGNTADRKSFTKASVIEKSMTGNGNANNGAKAYSKTAHKGILAEKLTALSGVDGGTYNDNYAKALLVFEASGEISKAIENDLLMNHNIQIVN